MHSAIDSKVFSVQTSQLRFLISRNQQTACSVGLPRYDSLSSSAIGPFRIGSPVRSLPTWPPERRIITRCLFARPKNPRLVSEVLHGTDDEFYLHLPVSSSYAAATSACALASCSRPASTCRLADGYVQLLKPARLLLGAGNACQSTRADTETAGRIWLARYRKLARRCCSFRNLFRQWGERLTAVRNRAKMPP
ncbi:hypothetical protein CGRA01v4_11882 [Colletotrichum graminicola]|nr:hypothetical protein CGRA01v4_11882 [Colletotrichum graminicola]